MKPKSRKKKDLKKEFNKEFQRTVRRDKKQYNDTYKDTEEEKRRVKTRKVFQKKSLQHRRFQPQIVMLKDSKVTKNKGERTKLKYCMTMVEISSPMIP